MANSTARLIDELGKRGTPTEIARLIRRSQPTVWAWFNEAIEPNTESMARIIRAYPELAPFAFQVLVGGEKEAA